MTPELSHQFSVSMPDWIALIGEIAVGVAIDLVLPFVLFYLCFFTSPELSQKTTATRRVQAALAAFGSLMSLGIIHWIVFGRGH